jgi:hypothetical protein
MNFTSKNTVGRAVSGVVIAAVVGLTGWVHHVDPVLAPTTAGQTTFAVQKTFTNDSRRMDSEVAPSLPFQMPGGAYYQPISSWYKNKHWWKRNAPIVGGAGGGALVGGLVGGGTGALVGGAVGGGGGYLYKRSRHHHYHHH